jgi:hypothetical protein
MKIDPQSIPTSVEAELKNELKNELQQELKSMAPTNVPAIPSGFPGAEIQSTESLLGLRGASPAQREQVFGQLSLQAAETALGSIFGVPVKFALDFLAGTGEGKRLMRAAGHAIDQGYEAQKALFKGDLGGVVGAFEGGSSHKQRESKFFAAVTDRIHQLQTNGGVLTAQDVAGFKQAIAYGDIRPLGTRALDLTKLDLAVGTNPFGPVNPDGGAAEFLSKGSIR